MNRLEKLMGDYSNFNYIFTDKLPRVLKGFCFDNNIYINTNRHNSTAETLVTVSEEIGHYMTGAGNITEQNTILNQKQEHKARQWGNQRLVSLDELIHCWEKGYKAPHEMAEELEVTTQCVINTIESYRATKGMSFKHNGYHFKFNSDTSIQICKLGGAPSTYKNN